jgi:hypothetical protein
MPIRVQTAKHGVVEFPDGTDESTMAKALRSLDGPADAPAAPPTAPKSGGGFVDALPSIAGTAFSLAGGSKVLPTGMALSALGGAAGESARQVIRSFQGQHDQVPDTISGRLRMIGGEAVGQGGMEGIGRGLMGAVAPVAKTLYGVAMRPAKALRQKYGTWDLLKQGFEDAVMPTAGGEARAGRLMGESRDAATKIAADSPQTFDLQRVLQKATDEQGTRMGVELKTAGIRPKIDAASEQIGNVLESNGPTVSAAQLLELRRGADAVADPAFKAAKLPGGAGRVPPGTEASVAKSMAGAERQTLDDALGSKWKATNATTRQRAGVQQMAKDASDRPNMLTNILAGGVGAGSAFGDGDLGEAAKTAVLFRALMSPSLQAGTALALPKVAKYGPRVADVATGGQFKNALLQFLSGQD